MDLFLWRHADAEDADDPMRDLGRCLTPRGLKQAARVAQWLERQLPDTAKVYCSPAQRCEETASALGRRYRVKEELGPLGSADVLLEVVQWPHSRFPALVVGHQPVLGAVISRLLDSTTFSLPVRKGAVWWIRTRERDGHQQSVVVAVQSPEGI